MAKVNKYLEDEKYTQVLADEIMDMFKTKSNKDNTYCEFDLIKGKMGDIKDNTWFNIDISNKDSELYAFKKALFDEDLADLTREQELDFQNDIEKLFDNIKDYILTNHLSELRDTIRNVCMPDSAPEVMPMSLIVIRNLDITDIDSIYDEHGPYVMSVFKDPNDPNFNPEIYKKAISERMKDILDYLLFQSQETGKTISVLFDEEKNKPEHLKHPSFEGINPQCKIKKMDWDLNISFFVDYTIKSPEEI